MQVLIMEENNKSVICFGVEISARKWKNVVEYLSFRQTTNANPLQANHLQRIFYPIQISIQVLHRLKELLGDGGARVIVALAELHASMRVDTIPHADNHVKIINGNLTLNLSFPLRLNLCKKCTS